MGQRSPLSILIQQVGEEEVKPLTPQAMYLLRLRLQGRTYVSAAQRRMGYQRNCASRGFYHPALLYQRWVRILPSFPAVSARDLLLVLNSPEPLW